MHFQNADTKEKKTMDAEMKRIIADLQRIRSARDSLQQKLDERIAKDDASNSHTQQTQILANTRKDRIVSLETELKRLKMLMATRTGEACLIAFFNDEENAGLNPYQVLREKLDIAETRIKLLEESTGVELQEHIMARSEMEAKLKRYTDILGDLQSSGTGESLQELTQRQHKQIQELQATCEYHKQTENTLMGEIETIGKAWATLEEQNSQKVFDLGEKEERILRLIAEKSKYEQKFASLSKQNATQNNLITGLRRQSDKQLEQIRKLEESERNLSQQLQVLEREVATKGPLIEAEKRRIADLVHQCNQQKDRADLYTNRCEQLNALLKTKTVQMERDSESKRRVEEDLAAVKKRLEHLTNKDGPVDASLVKELELYKRFVRCSTCNIDLKSHVISKCFHMFCKNCIDDLLNSRQRKCPSCGTAFGHQDVKPVFF